MKTVELKITLILEDDSKPSKWIPDVIWDVLNENEDIIDFECKETTQ